MPRSSAPPLNCPRQDLADVERIVLAAGTSFARGMKVLPPDRRYAMYAIYAFCRLVDDVADEEAPFETKRPQLEAWHTRIAGLYQRRASDALDRVLLAAIRQYDLVQADFDAVIDGMQMDAEEVIAAPDEAKLDLYCDRVASAVGRLSVRVFGDASDAAETVAHHLGRAFQLTNILRDLGEDAERGRLYLPRELLEANGVPLDPAGALASPRLRLVCRVLALRARGHFDAAHAAMARCRRGSMRPAKVMAAGYRAVLETLIRADWQEPARRLSVPRGRKLLVGLRALLPV